MRLIFHRPLEVLVWACYQEQLVEFRGRQLHDPGAYPEPPLSGKITWRITQPWSEPASEQEREALAQARQLLDTLKKRGQHS